MKNKSKFLNHEILVLNIKIKAKKSDKEEIWGNMIKKKWCSYAKDRCDDQELRCISKEWQIQNNKNPIWN